MFDGTEALGHQCIYIDRLYTLKMWMHIMDKSPLTENLKKEMRILKRTIKIYCYIEKEQPIGISKLSTKLDLPEHKVRYSLRMLEKEKMIEPSPVGATLTEANLQFKEELKTFLKGVGETALSLHEELSE